MSVRTYSQQLYSKTKYNTAANIIIHQYQYFIFDVVARRSPGGSMVQVSEFNLLNDSTSITGGTYVSWNNSFTGNSSSNTVYSPFGEEPSKANDGSTGTKWMDNRLDSECGLWIDFAAPTKVTGYRWYTANDSSERDPASWKVYGSLDNSNWRLLSDISGFIATPDRYTLAGTWTF